MIIIMMLIMIKWMLIIIMMLIMIKRMVIMTMELAKTSQLHFFLSIVIK